MASAIRAPTSTVALRARAARTTAARPARAVVACSAGSRRDVLNFAALSVASGLLAARPALAEEEEVAEAAADVSPLVAALLEKTEANKELNDKKRLATSYANFARSRTVTDGTCAFPDNLIGCENKAEMGGVKWLSDDLELECEGVEEGDICPAKAKGSFPSPFGV
mmetsp:Transcript_6931/g.25542  ORF Transcript_6931/g.25542 Transcript_6931/m.25542 type:complete len:167 (-) Transcript_6931:186-686(-)